MRIQENEPAVSGFDRLLLRVQSLSNLFPILISLAAIFGFLMIWWLSQPGIGLWTDSYSYIGGARNLLAGNGFVLPFESFEPTPITQYPPFYSLLLAGFGLLGIDPLVGARIVNGLLMSGLVVFGLLLFKADRTNQSRENTIAQILITLLLITSIPILETYGMALSEAAFLTLLMAGFYLLDRYLEKPSYLTLVLGSVVGGLLFITRFSGLPWIATVALSILFINRTSYQERLRHSAVYLLLCVVPFVFWQVITYLQFQAHSTRPFAFHLLTMADFWELVNTLAAWIFIPANISGKFKIIGIGLFILVMGFLIFGSVFSRHSQRDNPGSKLDNGVRVSNKLKYTFLFVVIYSTFIVFTKLFMDASVHMNTRILIPLYMTGLVIFVEVVRIWSARLNGRKRLMQGFEVGLLLVGLIFVFSGLIWVRDTSKTGLEFTKENWKKSPSLAVMRTLPENLQVFTNEPILVYIYANRASRPLPRITLGMSAKANENFENNIKNFKLRVHQSPTVIAYFYNATTSGFITPEIVQSHLDIDTVLSFDDGVLYLAK